MARAGGDAGDVAAGRLRHRQRRHARHVGDDARLQPERRRRQRRRRRRRLHEPRGVHQRDRRLARDRAADVPGDAQPALGGDRELERARRARDGDLAAERPRHRRHRGGNRDRRRRRAARGRGAGRGARGQRGDAGRWRWRGGWLEIGQTAGYRQRARRQRPRRADRGRPRRDPAGEETRGGALRVHGRDVARGRGRLRPRRRRRRDRAGPPGRRYRADADRGEPGHQPRRAGDRHRGARERHRRRRRRRAPGRRADGRHAGRLQAAAGRRLDDPARRAGRGRALHERASRLPRLPSTATASC